MELLLNDQLEKLWKSRIDSILGIVAAGETDHREVASMASHIGVDYYGRFLIELIQNAEDQALRAGLNNTEVLVVRTENTLAVFNQGEPFDEKGIRSVTSAGISFKDPEVTIGNKGIGFKAVFQISDSPEIFSAYTANEGIVTECGACFRLEKAPLSEETVREALIKLVKESLATDPLRCEKLIAVAAGVDVVTFCLSEIERAAPFKFPLPVDDECFLRRLEELEIDRDIIGRMTTMIVLPLLSNGDTQSVVTNAIAEIVHSVEPASMLLFLKGISSIHIIDKTRGINYNLGRKDRGPQQSIIDGSKLNHTRTFLFTKSANTTKRRTAHWWLAKKKLGKGGDNPLTAESERQAIVKAVSKIPGDNWDKVESVHASIALPRPRRKKTIGLPFGCSGKFCIGLPTMVSTGMPAWLDGPFHGNIPRTRIDLDSQPYNRVIFDGAKELFWSVIEHLKLKGNRADKVSVVLYFEHAAGSDVLSRELRTTCLFEKLPIVLSEDGTSFLTAPELMLPGIEDKDIFDRFFSSVRHDMASIFVLPAQELQGKAVNLLDEIAGSEGVFSSTGNYLRKDNGESLIEVAARHYRTSGPEFWIVFFEWLTETYELEEIAKQRIIPVGNDGIATAEERVFYRPVKRGEEADTTVDEQDDEDVLDDFDETILPEMNFFDEQCLDVRQKTRRVALTPLARKIAPEIGFTLVRRPRKPELINLVLAPHISHLANEENKEKAIAVLRLCADWLRGMGKKDLARVRRDDLLVPVLSSEMDLGWVSSNTVYLGKGWVEADHDELLEKAFGARPSGRLLPWDEFKSYVVDTDEMLQDWRSRMEMVGVASFPRIIEEDDLRKQAPLKSYSYSYLYVEPQIACPIPSAKEYWEKYLEYVSQRPAKTCSGQAFYIKPISWIDGLEDSHNRRFVMELVLRNPKSYLNYLTAAVQRQDGSDRQDFHSLWVYSIYSNNWEIVPTNDNYRSAAHTWFFGLEDQARTFVKLKLVSFIPEPFWDSRQILRPIGVYGPEDAPPEKIILELQNIAEQLSGSSSEMLRSIRSFVRVLYQWLQDSCKRNVRPGVLSPLNNRAIPLLQGENLVAVDLSKKPVIYLDDDPERGRFIKKFETAYRLPIKLNDAFKVLLNALEEVIGVDKVRRTSTSPLHVEFVPLINSETYSLFEYLQEKIGDHLDIDVAKNIAVLFVYCGQNPMDPKKAEFKKIWERFLKTKVVVGDFLDRNDERAVFDEMADTGPTLFVSTKAKPEEVLESCWQLLGVGYRLLFTAYANSIEKSGYKSSRFFSECGVTEAELDEIDSIIRRSEVDNLPIIKPILLAIWKKAIDPEGSREKFIAEWEINSGGINAVSSWLNISEKSITDVLKETQWIIEEQQQINLLNRFNLSIEEWQLAREALDKERIIFDISISLYSKCKRSLVALLKTEAVRRKNMNLSLVKDFIANYVDTECPLKVATQVHEENNLYLFMYNELIASLAGQSMQSGLPRLSKVLQVYAGGKPGDLEKRYRSEGSKRESMLYDQDVSLREQGAKEVLADYLKVMAALAEKLGEPFASDAIFNRADTQLFLSGWWANRYALLRALRKGIGELAPTTFKRFSEVKAFHKPLPWRELWKLFPELGLLNQAEPSSLPASKEKICGIESTSQEADVDLSKGSHGKIGSVLISMVNEKIDLAGMAQVSRNAVDRPEKTGSKGSKGKTYKTPPAQDKERIGLLGEAFVYETFKRCLPGFDYACWVSENREVYGFAKPIKYGQGYDFEYVDETGGISGCEGKTRCLIEVKATKEDGSGPFPMSDNEWNQAKKCYAREIEAVYVIVRVKNAKTAPEISDVIIDPVGLWQKGLLAFWHHDILVYLD